MPNSYVTSATMANGQITLSVQVDSFEPGETVEISGQATQNGGAFANFYTIKPVPAKPNVAANPSIPGDTAHYSINVVTSPLPPHKFKNDQDVTVVLRAAKVWLTVLGAHGELSSEAESPGVTTWNTIRQVSDIDGNSTADKSWPPTGSN